MATEAHCAYCFESLSAAFERRQPLSLLQVEELWDDYSRAEDEDGVEEDDGNGQDSDMTCLLYTSPSPRDGLLSRMPSSA